MVQDMLLEFPTLRIHAIGFGDGSDFEVLQQLTSLGRGGFAPSGRSIGALHSAFASVTSTITQTQTLTSATSRSSTFSFKNGQGRSSQEENPCNIGDRRCQLRDVSFEPANQFRWGDDQSISFDSTRIGFSYDGKSFKKQEYRTRRKEFVQIRAKPFTQGGMCLVYCFKDSSIPLFAEQRGHQQAMKVAGTDARMVAKISRYEDPWHNSFEVVAAYSKSSAVAKFYARVFMLAAADRLGWKGRSMAKILFVECYIYEAKEGSPAPSGFFPVLFSSTIPTTAT